MCRPDASAAEKTMNRLLRTAFLLFIGLLATVVVADDAAKKNSHARWEKSILRLEQADRDNPRPRRGVLFVGSSSIRFWQLESSFPDLPVINHGFGGSQIADTIHFADRIVWPFDPKVIVFYAGDNDIAVGKSAETVANDFAAFSAMVHEKLPDTHLIYIAIKPSIARWGLAGEMKIANGNIAAQCAVDEKRTFLDIWQPMLGADGKPKADLFIKDGLHLNTAGYELWIWLVNAELARLNISAE